MGRLIQFTKALSVIAALTVSLFAVRAEATVITWTLNNFVFDDTTTATGFFDWDTTTQSAVNWQIDVQAASFFSAYSYTDETGLASTAFSILRFSPTFAGGSREFRLDVGGLSFFDTPVANLAIVTSIGLTAPNGWVECFNCSPARIGNAGAYLSAEVGPVAVPAPAPIALLAVGLAGLGFLRRRRPEPRV